MFAMHDSNEKTGISAKQAIFNYLTQKINESDDKDFLVIPAEVADTLGIDYQNVITSAKDFIADGSLLPILSKEKFKRVRYTLPLYEGLKEIDYNLIAKYQLKNKGFIEKDVLSNLPADSPYVNQPAPESEVDEEEHVDLSDSKAMFEKLISSIQKGETPINTQSDEAANEDSDEDQLIHNSEEVEQFNQAEQNNEFRQADQLKQTELVADIEHSDYEKHLDVKSNSSQYDLDYEIMNFIHSAKSIYSSDILLSENDRNIISVLNETLQQNMMYFKSLTDALNISQNVKLVQALIDERNKLIQEKEELQQTLKFLQDEKKERIANEINPNRLRELQQNLISRTMIYLNSSNVDLSINRQDFKEEFLSSLSYLVNYALKIEE